MTSESPSSSGAEKAFVEWSGHLANYADLNGKKHLSRIDDTLDDLKLRLDEFEQLLDLVAKESSGCLFRQLPAMAEKFEEMGEVFATVDRLELMVAKSKEELDSVESRLVEAEGTVGGNASGIAAAGANSIKSFVKPFLFGSSLSSSERGDSSPPGKPPHRIFIADEFFPPKERGGKKEGEEKEN